jgi:hypothetical protein
VKVIPSIVIPLMKVNHVFLVPWIILGLPPGVLFQQQILIVAILIFLGLGGMLTRNRAAASFASACLLGLIVWGKIAGDLYRLPSLDSGLLLLEFMIVIFLMEASNTAILFDRTFRRLRAKNDDISAEHREGLTIWAGGQFLNLGKLIAAASSLSLGLLVVGDLVSVSFNQIAFSGILVLAAVVALLVLLTYGREPEERDT